MKEGYICPDTHFLIAYCFYSDSEALHLSLQERRLRTIYKKIKETGKMMTFYCHRWDYHNKLRNTSAFFREIVLHAKRKSSNEKEFKDEIARLMKNNVRWADFEQYIRVKLPYFSQVVLRDETGFYNAFYEEIDSYLEQFNEEVKDVEFDLGNDSPLVHKEYEILKELREGTSPQDRDLQLLATCTVYSRLYLPEGVLNLVTEDRELRKFAQLVIGKENERLLVLSADDFQRLIR